MRSSTGSGKVAGPALKLNTRFTPRGVAKGVVVTVLFSFWRFTPRSHGWRATQIPDQIIRTKPTIREAASSLTPWKSRLAQPRATTRHYMNEHARRYLVIARKKLMALFSSDSGGR